MKSSSDLQFKDNSIVAGATLTLIILIIQSYLTKNPAEIDNLQKISLLFFSISIPGLSLWFLVSKRAQEYKMKKPYAYLAVLEFLISLLAGFIGVGLNLYRYSAPAGIIFIIISVITIYLFYFIEELVNEPNIR